MCRSAMWVLECDAASVGRGRRLLAEQLLRWGVDGGDPVSEKVPDVLLAASEVLGNATRWCDGPICLAVEAHHDELRVAISDDHPGRAVMQHAGAFDETGRGLWLIDAMVDEWGQTDLENGRGKTVWFSVDIAEGSALGRECRRAAGE